MCAWRVGRAWLAAAVAVTLASGAAACGDSGDEGTDVADSGATTTAEENRAAAPPRRDAQKGAGGKAPADRERGPEDRGDRGSDPPRATGPGPAPAQSAAGTVAGMYRALLRGDAKAFCATQAAVGGAGRCDDGGMSKSLAGAPGVDVLRKARVVGVTVDGRRAKVEVRVGGETREVQLVRRGTRGWGVVEPPEVHPDIDAGDVLGAAPSQ